MKLFLNVIPMVLFILCSYSSLSAQKNKPKTDSEDNKHMKICEPDFDHMTKEQIKAYRQKRKEALKIAEYQRLNVIAYAKVNHKLQPTNQVKTALEKSSIKDKPVLFIIKNDYFHDDFYQHVTNHKRLFRKLKQDYICLWIVLDEQNIRELMNLGFEEAFLRNYYIPIAMILNQNETKLLEKEKEKILEWVNLGLYQSKN